MSLWKSNKIFIGFAALDAAVGEAMAYWKRRFKAFGIGSHFLKGCQAGGTMS